MDRNEKEELVASLRQTFDQTALVVVTHYKGLNVSEITALRGRMREAGAGFKVAKNRLVKRALEGTRFAGLDSLFEGPTAIAYSDDPVAAAKVAVDYAKLNDKLLIVGAGLGEKILDVEGVQALAKLPSLDELRGRLAGLVQAPATKVAGVLQAPAGQLARVLSAYANKDQAA